MLTGRGGAMGMPGVENPGCGLPADDIPTPREEAGQREDPWGRRKTNKQRKMPQSYKILAGSSVRVCASKLTKRKGDFSKID